MDFFLIVFAYVHTDLCVTLPAGQLIQILTPIPEPRVKDIQCKHDHNLTSHLQHRQSATFIRIKCKEQ